MMRPMKKAPTQRAIVQNVAMIVSLSLLTLLENLGRRDDFAPAEVVSERCPRVRSEAVAETSSHPGTRPQRRDRIPS